MVRLLILRSLRTRSLRTLLSMFGIILGVAGFLAIRVTNLTAFDSIVRLFEDTSGKSDFVISSAGSGNSGIPERLLRRIEDAPGIARSVPTLMLQTGLAEGSRPAEVELSLSGPGIESLILYGIDPQSDLASRNYIMTQGEFLSEDLDAYDIILVDTYARENELEIGNQVALLTPEGEQEFQLVGLIAKEGPGQINNGAFGAIPLRTAQQLFHRQGELDQIELLLSKQDLTGDELELIRADLQAQLGSEYSISYPATQGVRVAQMLDGYQIGLNFLSGMALFVGAFLIYNSFSMTVVERTREIGFLRTVGMTREQIIRLVLFEASLVGVIGAGIGVWVGLWLARGLARMMASLLEQQLEIAQLPPELLATSLFLGLSVTLFAAVIPAWQAGRISPLEALRVRGASRPGWLMRYGWILGVGLLLFSAGVLVKNPFPYDVQFRLGSLTVSSLFFGATLIIPASISIWERLARPVLQTLYGSGGRIGSSNIQRAKLRTTLTVAALMIGVSMILITRGMTDSFRIDLEVWIDAYIGGDLFVSSSAPMRSQVWRHLESVDGVAAVAPIRYFEVKWVRPGVQEETVSFMALDPAAHSRVTTFVFSDSQQNPQMAIQRLAEGEAVFISNVMAEKYSLSLGDHLNLRTRSGIKEFEVVGIVVDFFNQGLVMQGNWLDMRRYFRINDADAFLVKVGPAHSVDAVRERIDILFGQRDHLTVNSNTSIIERALGLLRQAYSLFDVLSLIALFVASLGVVNTLTMNVMERTQEIGMLRSIGLTQGQTLLMVLSEASLMGLIGGVLGLFFGVILTRIFLLGMTAMSGYQITFHMSTGAVWAGMLIALVVSQLAAILPARRAASIRILDAIHYE